MKKKITILAIILCANLLYAQDLDRTAWTVTTQTGTSYGNVTDGTTGLPEHLFDGLPTTYLALVKPGKSFSPIPTQPTGIMPSFTIDMKTSQSFDSIKWKHRSNHTYNYLRVYGIYFAGSNNGTDFTKIGNDTIWIPNVGGYVGTKSQADLNMYAISVPNSTYQYVKVTLLMWSDIYNSQNHDYLGAGATSGSTMQIAEFGLSKTIPSGLHNIDNSIAKVYPTVINKGEVVHINLSDANSQAKIRLYSTTGSVISESFCTNQQFEQAISEKGLYFFEVSSNGKKSITKVIVK